MACLVIRVMKLKSLGNTALEVRANNFELFLLGINLTSYRNIFISDKNARSLTKSIVRQWDTSPLKNFSGKLLSIVIATWS